MKKDVFVAALGGLAALFLLKATEKVPEVVPDTALTLTPLVNLSSTPNYTSNSPEIVTVGNILYVVWREDIGSGNFQIYFKRSTDGGSTFSPPINLSASSVTTNRPKIVIAASNIVYIFWEQSGHLRLSRSTDSGATFSSSVDATPTAVFAGAYNAVGSSSSVHVVYVDNRIGNYEVYYVRSTDGGSTFSPPINVSNTAGTSGQSLGSSPQIAVFGSNVYVSWTDTGTSDVNKPEIYFKKSTDSGATFGSVSKIYSDTTKISRQPKMIVDGNGIIYLIYLRGTTTSNGDLYFTKSADAGTTFTNPLNLTNTLHLSGNDGQDIAVDSMGRVFVVWPDTGPNGTADIWLRKSSDAGATFAPSVNLSQTNVPQVRPVIAVSLSGSVVGVAWEGSISPKDVYVTRSVDAGQSFDGRVNASNTPAQSTAQRIAVDQNGRIYVTWIELISTGRFEIYLRTSGGTSPPPPDTTIPTVTITKPANLQSSLFPINFNLIGAATDNVGVTLVEVSINGGNFNVASSTQGTSVTWTIPVSLATVGTYDVIARSKDTSGNISAQKTLTILVNPLYEAIFS